MSSADRSTLGALSIKEALIRVFFSFQERNDIQIKIIQDTEENKANNAAYEKKKRAESNKELYSDKFIQLELAKALVNNTKFYFSGETSPLGALMTKFIPN